MSTTGISNPIVQRLFNLMDEKGVIAKEVTDAVHLSGSSFTDWKKGRASPGVDALARLAPYFGVSLDYLITGHEFNFSDENRPREDPDAVDFVDEESEEYDTSNSSDFSNFVDGELISKFHRLPPELQGKVMSYLDGMLAVLPHLQAIPLQSQFAAPYQPQQPGQGRSRESFTALKSDTEEDGERIPA